MISKMVHIVTSDEGWILERLAKEIASRVPGVDYSLSPDPRAPIQYYITYGARNSRVSPVEVALFTHREDIAAAAKRFDDIAIEVDARVAMCEATALLLPDAPKAITRVIAPGVDLERFVSKLRIGVVGRTYATGRKGEDLVAAVQDIPGIEWCFTGPGWPGPSQYVPEADLPAFYRSLDYVLVPARIEGGPMSVVEALACGVEVIAPPVGWVPHFPHIEFETGNADSLRAVLTSLTAKRQALRASVLHQTWDAWAAQHEQLFNSIAPKKTKVRAAVIAPLIKVAIAVHGKEVSGSLGGPSVRGPLTTRLLANEGVQAKFQQNRTFAATDFDLVHVMNVWEPSECGLVIDQAKRSDKAVVLSPIFLDLVEHGIYSRVVPKILEKNKNPSVVNAAFAAVRKQIAQLRQRPAEENDVVPGYSKAIRDLVSRADHIICLSEDEVNNLEKIGATPKSYSVVKNCITSDIFFDGDPSLFESEYGLKDYVLVTGRLEPRKNQATLAYALRDAPYPVVFLGHSENDGYFQTVKIAAGPNVHFIGRIEPGSAMLASAFAGARVFCLPSWSEGAPLAAIEAAAAGCTMVLSDRSSEREYFGDLAYYCDPADPEHIRALIDKAHAQGRMPDRVAALQALARTELSQEKYAVETRQAYDSALANAANTIAPLASQAGGRVFIDLTTLAHRDGPPSGIARTEDRFAIELGRQFPGRVQYVVWNSHFQKFLPVSPDMFRSGEVRLFRGAEAAEFIRRPNVGLPFEEVNFQSNDRLVIFGGAWIRNQKYIRDLKALKKAFNIPIISTVYDVIQWKYSELFPQGIGEEFTVNCKTIIDISDLVLTCSNCSKRDIVDFGLQHKIALPPITVFRLGDDKDSIDPTAELQTDRISDLGGDDRFILYVSAIDARKNHRVLIDVWSRLIDVHGAKTPKLVLVGSKGWGSDPIMSAANMAKLKPFIIWMHGINDVTLEWLYANCDFTVYPSLYEGWGLPVAESLEYGKFCLASNGGSIPEIAPGIVETLDPMDFMGWFSAIDRYIRFPALIRQKEALIADYQRVTWAEAATGVAAEIFSATPHWRQPMLEVGTNYRFTNKGPAREVATVEDVVVGGLSHLEDNGAWTVGTATMLAFRVKSDLPVVLAMSATPFMSHTKRSTTLALSLNEDIRTNRSLTGPGQMVFLPLPGVENAVEPQDFKLRIEVLDPVAPKDLNEKASDSRLLGAKIHTLGAIHCIDLRHDVADERLAGRAVTQALLRLNADADELCVILELSALADTDVTLNCNGAVVQSAKLRKGRTQTVLAVVGPDVKLSHGRVLIYVQSKSEAAFIIQRSGAYHSIPADILADCVEQPKSAAVMGRSEGTWFGTPLELDPAVGTVMTNSQTVLDAATGGWSAAYDSRLWSNGHKSSIYVSTAGLAAGDSLSLQMTLSAYRWALHDNALDLFVRIGDAEPRLLQLEGVSTQDKILHFDLPPDHGPGEPLQISLWSNKAMMPSLLGNSQDTRSLSFAMHHLRLTGRTSMVMPRDMLVVPKAGDVSALWGAWHQIEDDGVWTKGGISEMTFRCGDDMKGAALTLDYKIFEGLLGRGPVEFSVFVNGVGIGVVSEEREGVQRVVLPIPTEACGGSSSLLTVAFTTPDGVSPSAASGAADDRILSVNISGIGLGLPKPADAETLIKEEVA